MQELRVCKFFQSGRERVGSYENGRIFDLNLCAARHLSTKNGDADAAGLANTSVPPYLEDFIKGGDATIEAARESLAWVLESGDEEGSNGEPLSRGLEEIKLEAPVLGDSKIICLGDTYESHMAVKGDPLPDHFGLFYKMTQVVVGPDDFVVIPKHHDGPVVYGTELTLVIGKEGRSIREEEAEDHVWGLYYPERRDATKYGVSLGSDSQGFRDQRPNRTMDRSKGPDKAAARPEAAVSVERQASAGWHDRGHEVPAVPDGLRDIVVA